MTHIMYVAGSHARFEYDQYPCNHADAMAKRGRRMNQTQSLERTRTSRVLQRPQQQPTTLDQEACTLTWVYWRAWRLLSCKVLRFLPQCWTAQCPCTKAGARLTTTTHTGDVLGEQPVRTARTLTGGVTCWEK
jgi:hypothetical protein